MEDLGIKIHIINNPNTEDQFNSYINSINNNIHIGIDLEFNNKNIGLMQIYFENEAIYLLNPNQLTNKQPLIDLLINKNIYKILHGAESMDIPYLYELLESQENISSFTHKLFDTRFLCEYYQISQNIPRKCTLYDGLYFFDVISKEKKEELEKIHHDMGPSYKVKWNVHNIKDVQIKYAYYDVIYLDKFLKNIFNKILTKTPELELTYKYIISINRFIYIDRFSNTNIINNIKKTVDKMNNYYTENGIFFKMFDDLLINKNINNIINFTFILQGEYFKNNLKTLLKYVAYNYFIDNFDVYINKNTKYNGKSTLNNTINKLKTNDFKRIAKFLETFKQTIETIIHKPSDHLMSHI